MAQSAPTATTAPSPAPAKNKKKKDPYAPLRCANAGRCTGYVYTMAYACSEGHGVCSTCLLASGGLCPSCRAPLPRTVALEMDPRVVQLMQPCVNRSKGCHYYFPKEELLFHQVECRYSQKQCFSAKCNFLGTNKELEAHMMETHHERVVKGTEAEFVFKKLITRKDDVVHMQFLSCYLGSFWVKYMFSGSENQLYGAVQYLGPKQEAEKLEYEFEMKESDDKGFTGLKCIYTGKMNTHVKTFETLFETQDCFTVTREFALYFEKNDSLRVQVKVREIAKDS